MGIIVQKASEFDLINQSPAANFPAKSKQGIQFSEQGIQKPLAGNFEIDNRDDHRRRRSPCSRAIPRRTWPARIAIGSLRWSPTPRSPRYI
jgi:hypothetical protein